MPRETKRATGTFTRVGTTYQVAVWVETTTDDADGRVIDIKILLDRRPPELADGCVEVGEITLEDGRRWRAYFLGGGFVLNSVELGPGYLARRSRRRSTSWPRMPRAAPTQ